MWLTDFILDGDKLRITGYSPEASNLIPLLERSPHFGNVHFAAASTDVSGSTAGGQKQLERFVIAMTVVPMHELDQ